MDKNVTANTATIRKVETGFWACTMVEPGGRNTTIGAAYLTLREAVSAARSLGLARLFVRPSMRSNRFGWHEIAA